MATLQDYIKNLGGTAATTALGAINPGLGIAANVVNSANKAYSAFTKPKTATPATSSPSASPTAPAPITPPKDATDVYDTASNTWSKTGVASPSLSSSAAQQFVSSQSGSPATSYSGYTPTVPAPVQKPAESEYLKYMRSIFNPQELDRARKEQEMYNKQVLEASKRLGDIRTEALGLGLSGREAQEAALDKSGGFQSGNQNTANLLGRRTNAELARLGVAETGAAASLAALTGARDYADTVFEQMLDAGATVFEAEQAALEAEQGDGFTLGEGQVRYDSKGNIIASGPAKGGSLVGVYEPGVNPTVDAYIKGRRDGTYKPSDIPAAYKDLVAQGLASTANQLTKTGKETLAVVDELLLNPKISEIFGPIDQFTGGYLGEGALAKNKFNQLLGMLKLEERQKLKGSGAISDFEFKVLGEAATALGRNLGDEQGLAELQKLKDKLMGTAPIPTTPTNGDVWKAPDGIEYEYSNGGWEPMNESFSSVGNTSASIQQGSRLAQVNNNPGNLRFVGQPGAVQGEGGFAKFSTPQAGVQALQRQIQLDASRGLTLAKFVEKYAPPSENDTQKYIQDMVAWTGASPQTPISQIDLMSLTRAVARKESSSIIG